MRKKLGDQYFAPPKDGKGPIPDKWAGKDVQRLTFGLHCVKVAEATLEAKVSIMPLQQTVEG